MSFPVKMFATSGSEGLAHAICRSLTDRLPEHCTPHEIYGGVTVTRFDNDELQVQLSNVRGCFVVVVHTQVPPVNDHLIELIALLDAIRNSRPKDVLVVFPYMPYARSDRKNQPRISTMAYRIARIISSDLEVKRVILLDPHATHTKHYFEPAAEEVSAVLLLAHWIKKNILDQSGEEWVFVHGDGGSAKRFTSFPSWLHLPVAYIDKERPDNTGRSIIKGVIGDVAGKNCLMGDDEILSAGTIIGDADAVLQFGARSVVAASVHGVLRRKGEGPMFVAQRLADSNIDRIVVTDSIPVADKVGNLPKFTVLSVASLLAEAIKRTVLDQSLTDLHDPQNVGIYWPESE